MNLEVRTKDYIENLYWRYATKQFDPNQKLSDEDLEMLMESLRLSASSYGLQPYEILIVEDEDLKKQLRKAAWNQSQLTDASHIFIFANYRKIDESHLNSYLKNIASTRDLELKDLNGLKDMIKNTVLSNPEDQQRIWGSKQTYIALGNLLSAAAEFKIDACPMEGFDNEQFDKILGLKEKNLTTSVIAALGYRSEEDQTQHFEKVRKSKSELFHKL